MGQKSQFQFGVWMDGNNATVVGRDQDDQDKFLVLGHIKNENSGGHSSEHTANNAQQTAESKFFKEIAHKMQNAHEIHIIGHGIAQEKFRNYLAETPQFKNTNTTDGTEDKMSDEQLVSYFAEKFNK